MTESARRPYTPPQLIRPAATDLTPEAKTFFYPSEVAAGTGRYGPS